MKIEGIIKTCHAQSEFIAGSVAADNLSEMTTTAEGNYVITRFCSTKTRSVIASMDDYLMHIIVAEEVCESPAQTGKISGEKGIINPD
jgi:hypothetical protein